MQFHTAVHKKFRAARRRIAAGTLAAALAVSSVAAADFGTFLRQDGVELSDTAQMVSTRRSLVGGGQVTEHLLTYAPESGLQPIVAYGTTLYGRSDLDYVANYLAGTGMRVTAGVNASFFTMSNGIPFGPVVTEGVVRSAASTGNAVGFRADGSAVIGQPQLDVRVSYPNGEVGSVLYNKALTTANGAILYSGDYDTQTRNAISAYNVVLRPETDELRFGQSVAARVTAITPAAASCPIPADCFVLSMATDTDYAYTFQHQLGALAVGDTVTIHCTVAAGWEDVLYACSADELLVEGGAAKTAFTLDSAKNKVARTAAGLRQDGSLVLYTVDRGSDSAGMTLQELARRMAELGCVTAVNLDGGGSTTFSACLPGDSALTTQNAPSDGAQRRCANFIFLARPAAAAGAAAHLHLYPYDAAVLAGGQLSLTVKATDAAYNPVAVPGGVRYTASGGDVSESGVFTAGQSAGTAVVQAAAGDAAGSRTIRVVAQPSAISLRNESTGQTVTSATVPAGGTLNLAAAASYLGYSLAAQDGCFTWSVTDGIGQIDENGTFTAAPLTAAAAGTVTCQAGGTTATLAVSVTPLQPEGGAVHGFEPNHLGATSGAGLVVAANHDLGYVRYGASSLQAHYDLSQGDAVPRRQVRAALNVALPAEADTVGLWIYGDSSNNSLSLLFDGETESKWLAQLSFQGWKYVSTAIPDGASAVTGFAVTEYEDAAATSGIFYLDQMIAARGDLQDVTAPAIAATAAGGALQVSVTDGGSGVAQVTATLDGAELDAEFTDGAAVLPLPADGAAHQVHITAADRCGNLASRTVELSGALDSVFSDLDGHWSKPYADYCRAHGILDGSQNAAGAWIYRPDAAITRQEFAVALIRFLGVDPEEYADTALPFTDADAIADWALPSMRAAYALGLVTGSQTRGGLYANPTQSITRQESMVILGRTQTQGYTLDDLSAFSDAAALADWAREFVAAMVSRGIISGSHGRLSPAGTVTRGQVAKMLYYLY